MIASQPGEYPRHITRASALFSAAENCLRKRRITEALALYSRAEEAGYDPDACAGARWICHMLQGDFAAAWRESDDIEQRGSQDPNRFWTGAPLAGKRVLIRCLHGLGDTIQFIRYAPLLRRVTSHLTIEAQPLLKELIERSDLADHVMTWREPEPPYDEQIEVIELPRIFGSTLQTIPAQTPYLRGYQRQERSDSSSPRIGVVWASSAYNPARSIPLPLLERFFSHRPDLRICSFQAEPDRQDLLSCRLPVLDLFDGSGSIVAAAEALASVDLFLTVDTMMAHLGGALAIPVWTMLPFEADWRWMLERDDSPWYPTMTLFRQSSPGNWQSVLEQVGAALDRRFPRP